MQDGQQQKRTGLGWVHLLPFLLQMKRLEVEHVGSANVVCLCGMYVCACVYVAGLCRDVCAVCICMCSVGRVGYANGIYFHI